MHRIEYIFNSKSKHCQIPSNWNELTKEQLIWVSKAFILTIDKAKFNTYALKKFTGLKWHELHKVGKDSISGLISCFKWLHDTCYLTTQLIPILNASGWKLNGSEPGLMSLTFEQFFWYSEPYFSQFLSDRDPEKMNFFIASIYCRKKYEFDPDNIEAIAKRIRNIQPSIKQAIFFSYLGCRNFLADKFPEVFSKRSDDDADDMQPLKLVDYLNDGDLSRNEKILKANLYQALAQMQKRVIDNEALREKLKKQGHEV